MTGETDLDTLLASMSAELRPETFVFMTIPADEICPVSQPKMVFEEDEGTTLIVTMQQAKDAGLSYEFPSRMITLNIHSSLDAVGFMARIATALAAKGMGVNPVAGFFHDHLFVPEDKANEAMAALRYLAANPSAA